MPPALLCNCRVAAFFAATAAEQPEEQRRLRGGGPPGERSEGELSEWEGGASGGWVLPDVRHAPGFERYEVGSGCWLCKEHSSAWQSVPAWPLLELWQRCHLAGLDPCSASPPLSFVAVSPPAQGADTPAYAHEAGKQRQSNPLAVPLSPLPLSRTVAGAAL